MSMPEYGTVDCEECGCYNCRKYICMECHKKLIEKTKLSQKNREKNQK